MYLIFTVCHLDLSVKISGDTYIRYQKYILMLSDNWIFYFILKTPYLFTWIINGTEVTTPIPTTTTTTTTTTPAPTTVAVTTSNGIQLLLHYILECLDISPSRLCKFWLMYRTVVIVLWFLCNFKFEYFVYKKYFTFYSKSDKLWGI